MPTRFDLGERPAGAVGAAGAENERGLGEAVLWQSFLGVRICRVDRDGRAELGWRMKCGFWGVSKLFPFAFLEGEKRSGSMFSASSSGGFSWRRLRDLLPLLAGERARFIASIEIIFNTNHELRLGQRGGLEDVVVMRVARLRTTPYHSAHS